MRRVLLLALLLLAFVQPAALAAYATASTLNYDNEGRWTHQHTLTYWYSIDEHVPSWLSTAIREAAAEWDQFTNLTLIEGYHPSFHISLYYDAIDGNKNYFAYARVAYHQPSYIVFDTADNSFTFTQYVNNYYRYIACHELGHTLGLGHGGYGCMQNAKFPTFINQTSAHPGADDIALLNRQYTVTGHTTTPLSFGGTNAALEPTRPQDPLRFDRRRSRLCRHKARVAVGPKARAGREPGRSVGCWLPN